MTTNARTLTLGDLRQTFQLQLNAEDTFFTTWLEAQPALDPLEQNSLERLAANYSYLSQEQPPLEEIVKLVVVSPLLDLAGFYQPPFLLKTEVGTTLEVTDDPDLSPVQGKIDLLIIQNTLWVLVIESKPARLDVTVGIPQALVYLLSAPTEQLILYGMVTNGREVVFLRLDRSLTPPQYSRSLTYRLMESNQERKQVLQGLKRIGQLVIIGNS